LGTAIDEELIVYPPHGVSSGTGGREVAFRQDAAGSLVVTMHERFDRFDIQLPKCPRHEKRHGCASDSSASSASDEPVAEISNLFAAKHERGATHCVS
jgi:hypothetical protein